MEDFILQLGNMSMQAAVAVGAVLIARLLFVRFGVGKKYAGLLWFIPYFCMICPWKLKSPFGLWGSRPKEYQIERLRQAAIYIQNATSPVSAGGDVAQEIKNASHMAATADSVSMVWTFSAIGGSIWLVGILIILVYSLLCYFRLKRRLLCSICVRENIYLADDIDVPFVFGLIHPRIYVPSGMGIDCWEYVIEHEKTHIRQKDPIKKMAAFAITAVHWFNPFAWLAFLLLGKDMEMACDEEVIERIGVAKRQEYAGALLRLSGGRRILLGAPLAFGEGNVKSRIQNIMQYRKTLWLTVAAAIFITVVLAACFFTRHEEQAASKAQEVLGEAGPAKETKQLTADMVQRTPAGEEGGAFLEAIQGETVTVTPSYLAEEDMSGAAVMDNQAAHREGFKEAVLHLYIPKMQAEAGITEDMLPPEEERERLAQRALQELYDLTGTLIEECYYYSGTEWNDYIFALTQDDMDHGRTFLTRYYSDIQDIFLTSRRRLWYSPVDMFALPENYGKMSEEEKAVWFVTHAGNYNGKKVSETRQPYDWDSAIWHVIMEDDTAYEVTLDSEINSVTSITGPYPDSNIKH